MGYHILKVTEHTLGRLLTLTDTIPPNNQIRVSDYVYQTILSERQASAYQTAHTITVSKLREKAEIQIFPAVVSEVAENRG